MSQGIGPQIPDHLFHGHFVSGSGGLGTRLATAQVTEDRLFTDALLYVLSCVGLSSIALKQEQLTAIHYLYQRKDVFLWLPTGFGKSVCYEVLPFLFDFVGSKSGSIVLRWAELLLGLHTYCSKPSPSSIDINSS